MLHVHQHDALKLSTEQQQPPSYQASSKIGDDHDSDPFHSPPTSPAFEGAHAAGRVPIKRRKVVGGLEPKLYSSRHATGVATLGTRAEHGKTTTADEDIPRRLRSNVHRLPQRRRAVAEQSSKTPRSASTIIASIWKTVYGSIRVEPPATFAEYTPTGHASQCIDAMNRETFSHVNAVCLKASTLSKSARALEVVIQAHWVDCYNARIRVIADENRQLSTTEARMTGLGEACSALGWTEKELRNRMTIWRGYHDIKEAGGWASLVFAGSGIYSICKYRIGFQDGLMQRLSKLQASIEVAADTLHPAWRQLLAAVDHSTDRRYTGHPHDWVVSADKAALPLASTYQQWDPEFSFEHLNECILDTCWGGRDPRRVHIGDTYACSECGEQQSDELETNKCGCFQFLIAGSGHIPAPVQVGRCPRGKNNGLFARCSFERGTAIGEFVGLVTKGIKGMDVMMGGHGDGEYQIFQRRFGNYTRFINHSCAPNAQFTKFIWRGIERILVVSKGIESGMEITVDYSASYWTNLDKVCLCGELCCRVGTMGRRGILEHVED